MTFSSSSLTRAPRHHSPHPHTCTFFFSIPFSLPFHPLLALPSIHFLTLHLTSIPLSPFLPSLLSSFPPSSSFRPFSPSPPFHLPISPLLPSSHLLPFTPPSTPLTYHRDVYRVLCHAAECLVSSSTEKERLPALWRDLLRVSTHCTVCTVRSVHSSC